MVLGGDGYIGWPLAMRLARSYPQDKLLIVDNEWRRNTTSRCGYKSAVPIASPRARTEAFRSAYELGNLVYLHADITSGQLEEIICRERPHTIYHLAQQPSAPYSMAGVTEAIFTLHNNEAGNMRLLWAVKQFVPDAHIIKLGSFGEYARNGMDIPEGYFTMHHNGTTARHQTLFPREADDIYHISKINDTNYIAMACRQWQLTVTDVMQSIVFGTQTGDMQGMPELCTRFDYDELFGTVANRFVAQAISGNPLTVYGSGNQHTGIMVLADVVHSLARFVTDVPVRGTHRIVNHLTEKRYTINGLAREVAAAAAELGYKTSIVHGLDPRNEHAHEEKQFDIATHYLDDNVTKTSFHDALRDTFRSLAPFRKHISYQASLPRLVWHRQVDGQPAPAKGRTAELRGEAKDHAWWEHFRLTTFPGAHINMNTCMLGSLPAQVIRSREYSTYGAHPLGSYKYAEEKRMEVTDLCSTLWPAEGYTVKVCAGTSQTINLIALAMLRAFHRGTTGKIPVLTTRHEHTGGIGPFEHLPEYDVHYLDDRELDAAAIRQRVRSVRPALTLLSHVFYDTGNLNAVNEWAGAIKQECPDCHVIVDAAQSLGLHALPAGHADVIIASTHKWLMGPHGGGLIWLKPAFMQWLEGLCWTDIKHSAVVQGGQDFLLNAGIAEAMKLYKSIGAGVILNRSIYLAASFLEQLTTILTRHNIKFRLLTTTAASPVLSVGFPAYDPYPLYCYLNDHHIHIKCIMGHEICGTVLNILRIGIPYFETEPRLCYAVNEISYFLSRKN